MHKRDSKYIDFVAVTGSLLYYVCRHEIINFKKIIALDHCKLIVDINIKKILTHKWLFWKNRHKKIRSKAVEIQS